MKGHKLTNVAKSHGAYRASLTTSGSSKPGSLSTKKRKPRSMSNKTRLAEAGYDTTIRKHFAQEARTHGAAPTSTMADEIVRSKETEVICEAVATFVREQRAHDALNNECVEGQRRNGVFHIVDLGCGNGTTLCEIARTNTTQEAPQLLLTGVEYTPELRAIAEERLSEFENARVLAGDVRTIDSNQCEPGDVIILQRVLINLLDRADQNRALDNVVSLLRPGGLLVAIESFETGLVELNSARLEFGLSELTPAHHNLYLTSGFFDHPSLAPYEPNSGIGAAENFLSTHYFVSRVLHEAWQKETGESSKRNSHFVRFFSAALPDGVGAYSPLKFILRRKVPTNK